LLEKFSAVHLFANCRNAKDFVTQPVPVFSLAGLLDLLTQSG
jgi:hypothetical protein